MRVARLEIVEYGTLHGRTTLNLGSAVWGGTAAYIFVSGRWSVSRIAQLDPVGQTLGSHIVLSATLVVAAGLILTWARRSQPQHANMDQSFQIVLLTCVLFTLVIALGLASPSESDYAVAKRTDLVFLSALFLALTLGSQQVDADSFTLSLAHVIAGLGALLGLLSLAAVWAGSVDRAAALGGGPNTLGRAMGACLLASLYLYVRSPAMRPLAFPSAAIAVMALLASGSRGALIATSAAILTGWSLLFMGGHIRFTIGSFGRFVAASSLVVFGAVQWFRKAASTDPIVNIASERYWNQTIDSLQLSARPDVYRTGLHCIQEAGWRGVGLGNFDTFHTLPFVARYPHNGFIEIACETGYAGLLVLMLILAAAVHVARRCPIDHNAVFIGAFIALHIAFSQFSGDLFDARVVVVAPALVLSAIRKRST
jgi:hypothetical protein